MAASGLMLHVADKQRGVGKSCRQLLCRCNESAAIVADVDDESVARHEIIEYFVEIALAHCRCKRRTTYVADVVVEYAITHA